MEAARAYNVPVETLRRRVAGIVHIDCVLTKEEESRLADYCIAMADMGFGLTREAIMVMAYNYCGEDGTRTPL